MKNLETIDSKLKMNIQLLAAENGADNSQTLDQKDDNKSSQNNEQSQSNEKIFTQADFDKAFNKAYAKLSSEFEKKLEAEKNKVEEAKKLETMSAEERTKNEIEALRKQLEEVKQAEARKDLTNSTLKEMATRGIDADFLDFVLGVDADTTKSRLDIFEAKFNSMVDAKVEAIIAERIKGKTPITSTKTTTSSEFTADDVKKMSVDEINRNWDKIKHIKLG